MKRCSKCNRELPLGEYYKAPSTEDGLRSRCKECFNKQISARNEKNITNGMCRYHSKRPIDPRSKVKCTQCFERTIQQDLARKQEVASGLCFAKGCNLPHEEGVMLCTYHRKINQENSARNKAIERGMYWLHGTSTTDLFVFQGSRCAVCSIKENGRKHHRDHNHLTGWLRGWLCGPCNTKLTSAHVDESNEKAIAFFNEKELDPYFKQKYIDYLLNPPYFKFLDSLGIERPGDNEKYIDYVTRYPERAMQQKVSRRTKNVIPQPSSPLAASQEVAFAI